MIFNPDNNENKIFTCPISCFVRVFAFGEQFTRIFSFIFPHFSHLVNVCNEEELKENASGEVELVKILLLRDFS